MERGHRIRLIAVPLLLLPVLGGCGLSQKAGPRVASAGQSAGASSAPPKDDAQRQREFARRVRAAGVDVPDPNADGMIPLPAQKAGAGDSAEAKKMQTAIEKCREFLPSGGEPPKMAP